MNYTPESPNNYIGKQVIINSDRLIFNAKNDSILLFSDKVIGFSTNGNFHFDTLNNGTNKFVINAPKIYLGLRYDDTYANEPILLGNRTEAWLNDLIDVISYILDDVKYKISYISQDVGKPTGPNIQNESLLKLRYNQLNGLRDDIKYIMSDRIKAV
jgi:hypothetical protein